MPTTGGVRLTTWQIASWLVARNRSFWIGIAATTAGAILGLLSMSTSPLQGSWLGTYSGVILFFAGIVFLAVAGTMKRPSPVS